MYVTVFGDKMLKVEHSVHQEVKTYLPGLSTPSEVFGGPRSIGR
jgi:hypothetical protein